MPIKLSGAGRDLKAAMRAFGVKYRNEPMALSEMVSLVVDISGYAFWEQVEVATGVAADFGLTANQRLMGPVVPPGEFWLIGNVSMYNIGAGSFTTEPEVGGIALPPAGVSLNSFRLQHILPTYTNRTVGAGQINPNAGYPVFAIFPAGWSLGFQCTEVATAANQSHRCDYLFRRISGER